MIRFRFLDDAYYSSKQNHKSLAIRNLYADISLDSIIIGEIQCYYLNSHLLFRVNTDFLDFDSDTLTEAEIKFIEETGVSDEDDYDKYIHKNFLLEDEYEDFINDNEIEIVDGYLRADKDVLYIKELKLYEDYEFAEILKELKSTLYLLFDYKDFIVVDDKYKQSRNC